MRQFSLEVFILRSKEMLTDRIGREDIHQGAEELFLLRRFIRNRYNTIPKLLVRQSLDKYILSSAILSSPFNRLNRTNGMAVAAV